MPNASISYEQAIKEVCGPGQPYELKPTQIRGKICRVFVNAPLTLHDLLADNASDLDFVIYEDERLSFKFVYQQASALAQAMVDDYGIQPGDRVALAMRNYPEWVITFFATTSIGAIVVPLNAWWSAPDIAYSLKNCTPSLMIVDQERLDRLAEVEPKLDGMRTIRVRSDAHQQHQSDDWKHVLEGHAGAAMPANNVDPDDDAIIFYTSGSTGHPKGSVSSHRAIIHALMSWEVDWELRALRGIHKLPEDGPQGGMLIAIPLFHVSGCHAAMLTNIRTQRKAVCMYKWDVHKGLELIEREQLTGLLATPAISGDVVIASRSSNRDLSSLIVLGGGGAPRPPEQVKAIGKITEQLVPGTGWGMTETNAIGVGIASGDYLSNPASSGLPSAVMDLRIVDEHGNQCPTGESGELQIKGTGMFRQYWGRPDTTAAAHDGDWFRTGDAAKLNEYGFLFIVDRIKDIIIRGGENIGCGAVEAALAEHPSVIEASVYSVPDQRLGEEVGTSLYVSKSVDEDELKAFLGSRIAAFEIPRHVFQQTEPLPRIASGKIAKRRLRDEAIDRLGLDASIS